MSERDKHREATTETERDTTNFVGLSRCVYLCIFLPPSPLSHSFFLLESMRLSLYVSLSLSSLSLPLSLVASLSLSLSRLPCGLSHSLSPLFLTRYLSLTRCPSHSALSRCPPHAMSLSFFALTALVRPVTLSLTQLSVSHCCLVVFLTHSLFDYLPHFLSFSLPRSFSPTLSLLLSHSFSRSHMLSVAALSQIRFSLSSLLTVSFTRCLFHSHAPLSFVFPSREMALSHSSALSHVLTHIHTPTDFVSLTLPRLALVVSLSLVTSLT